MKRINVVGTSGSGKSTFARALAEKLGHPYIEMDQLFWKPNWTQPSDPEFFEKIRSALDHDQWVLDGNYDRTVKVKWEKVTTVVWLDYSFRRTLSQVLIRSVKRAIVRNELWPGTGNKESFIKMFQKDSIVWWMITTHSKMRARYLMRMKDPAFSHVRFVQLRSPREAAAFLKSV